LFGSSSRECRTVAVSDPLDKTLERMSREGCATLAVMAGNKLVGLLTLENLGELVMVQSAVAKGTAALIEQRLTGVFTGLGFHILNGALSASPAAALASAPLPKTR